jgi:hypothetical protein
MKRLTVILVLVGVVFVLVGIDPAFSRAHRAAPMGGFSLWQMFIGGIFIVVMFSIFAGGSSRSKETIEKEKKESKEQTDQEKKEKGLLRYYGELIGAFLLPSLVLPILALTLGGIFWLFS